MTNPHNAAQPTGGPIAGKGNPAVTSLKDHGAMQVPQVNLKEVGLVVVALLFIGGLIAGYWFYSQQGESQAGGTLTFSKELKPERHSPEAPVSAGGLSAKPTPTALASSVILGAPPSFQSTDSMHADVYFDFDRSRLRADAVGILQEKAATLKSEANWAVLIQGYADQNGPVEYNKALAARRAASVKQFLVELGVPENTIKVVTLGKEGSICDDQSKECQRLNRRVHLEMIKRGAPTTAMEQIGPAAVHMEQGHSAAETLEVSDKNVDESGSEPQPAGPPAP